MSKMREKWGLRILLELRATGFIFLDRIAPFIEWYSSEFVARDRRCYPCRQAVLTIELDIEDLIGALRYAQIDGPMLTQSIIDWSHHIRENAKTFRADFEPTRPELEEKSPSSGNEGSSNERGSLKRTGSKNERQ